MTAPEAQDDQGENANADESESDDDDEDDDVYQLYSHVRSISIELNAVNVRHRFDTESYDVLSASPEDDDWSACSSNSSAIGSIDEEWTKECHDDFEDDPDAVRAQVDTGAFASVTDKKHMLHDYREFSQSFPCPVTLMPAKDGSDITPEGCGYLHTPAPNAHGFIAVRTFYSPNLRTTVIDERDFHKYNGGRSSDFTGDKIEKRFDAGTFSFRASHRLRRSQDVVVHGVLRHGKCYTAPLIPPDLPADHPNATPSTSSEAAKAADPEFKAACERATIQAIYAHQEREYATLRDNLEAVPLMYHDVPFHEFIQQNTPVDTIQVETERLLWHQRLGHPSDYYLYNAHKHVKGVPQFHHEHPVLDKCPTCIQAKQTKEPAGQNTTRTATMPYQGLSVDFSFSGTKSKNKDRERDYLGFNGETSWILVTDHFTRRHHGDTRLSKASPLAWLRHFLKNHSPRMPNKYVYLDQGGELFKNPAVRQLFKEFDYDIRPTGADASNQNGPVERAHLTIGNGIRAMLHGANMDVRFWPYAFHHFLRIKNAIPSKDQSKSPYTLATGKVDDFTGFRTFGCRVWVRPPGRRAAKFRLNSRRGLFIGYLPNTTKNIMWYDPETNRVKIAKHARFDEGMNDLPFESIPPNVQHLTRVRQGEPLPAETQESVIDEFHFVTNPFSHTLSKVMKVKGRDSSFGLDVDTDVLYNRAYVSDVKQSSSAAGLFSSLKATRNKIRGAYIVSIAGEEVFTKADVDRVLKRLFDEQVTEFEVEFAPEKRLSAAQLRKALLEHDHDLFSPEAPADEEHTPELDVASIRAIASILHPDLDFSESSISNSDVGLCINALQSRHMTDEEEALGSFTRNKLKRLSTWHEWQAGEFKQLDRFHALQMYGDPVPRPTDPNAIILRPHWQYKMKSDGKRRSRNCCDGSPRAAPVLHGIASTYSSCVEQPIQRLFFALSAHLGYGVYGGDATDAFAHSPPPDVPTYVSVDEAYADWYESRFGKRLDRSFVLPVLHALQGHPESGRLWEEHINKILLSPELGFRHTTHDRTIYSATIDGQPVLLLRQVDDFAIACADEDIAKRIYGIIGERLQLAHETKPPFEYFGLLTEYNGVDVVQTRDTITLKCSRYIQRVLRTHSWTVPDTKDPLSPRGCPLPTDCLSTLYAESGPTEGTQEHANLATAEGFSYRTLLGELLYAYVTCRPDIGYAITTLSKFSVAPAKIHYTLLKGVAKYLRRTIDWGIVYRKSRPSPAMPASADVPLAVSDDLPPVPTGSSPDQLTAFVDAAHANDLRNRRSTTGYAFTLCNGAVAYRTKTQSITATSSTEAEFLAAVLTAKQAKYLRAVLKELGFPQHGPTPIYEDNMSAIKMINARVPTERSRHIDIQHFAIQDWKEAGDIVMRHIPGIINPADDLTKPLGWVLHARHARRIMGHYR